MTRKENWLAQLDKLRRVDGIGAIPPNAQGQQRMRVPETFNPTGNLVSSHVVAHEELDKFVEAGWSFVNEDGSEFDPGASHHVYRDGDGHIKIDSGNLNVRFVESASTEEISALLNAHQLSIKRQLKFAPNLFTVGIETGGNVRDSVDAARQLSSLPAVQYAEPVLIEPLGGRQSGR